MRSEASSRNAWFALAAIVPLTMLVTYHKPYDVKLIVLLVPDLFFSGVRAGQGPSGAVPNCRCNRIHSGHSIGSLFLALTDSIQPNLTTVAGKLQAILILRPASIILVGLAAFYLWVFLKPGHPARDAMESISIQRN